MFAYPTKLSLIAVACSISIVQASSLSGTASAGELEEEAAHGRSPAEASPRLEVHRERSRRWAERLRIATPEMREGRRERLLERLREASPAERRRVLRRERRIMRFLPEEERRAIQLENRRFRKEHGIGSPRLRPARDAIRQLGFSAEEGRLLRARLHKLPKKERQELRRQIMNVRELPEAERELLRERLDEMKSLSEDEERAFHERARRWEEMPEERRDKLRLQMKRLRELPADERIELLERVLDASEGEGDES